MIVSLCQMSHLSAISGREQVTFDEMMMISALYQTNMLSWIFIVLSHWSNIPRQDMSLHLDTLFWLRGNQSLLLLLNAACLVENNKYQFDSFWFDLTILEHANHYFIDAALLTEEEIVLINWWYYLIAIPVHFIAL